MDQSMYESIESLKLRTCRLERQVKITTSCLLSSVAILLFILFTSQTTKIDKDLKVRSLVIVDENGKERIFIGAPVPAPTIDGKIQHRRNLVSSGIQFKDANGNERGGIASMQDGSFVVGIDDPLIKERAHLYFIPKRGSGLLLGNPDTKNYISLLVPAGEKKLADTPSLTIARGDTTIIALPSDKMKQR